MAADFKPKFPHTHIDAMLLMVEDELLQRPEGIVVSLQDVALLGVWYGGVAVHALVAGREIEDSLVFPDHVAAVCCTGLQTALCLLLRLGAMVPQHPQHIESSSYKDI